MSQIDTGDLLPTQRIAIIVYTLYEGKGKVFTTAELAQLVGLRSNSMWEMLCKLSRILPISQEHDGWRML